MSKRAIAWIVAGLLVLLLGGAIAVVVLAGGAAYFLARDGAPGLEDEREIAEPPQVIALGDGRAIFLEGTGIGRPMIVRRVDANDAPLGVRERWSWTAPTNRGGSAWTWSHAAGRIAGEVRQMEGAAVSRFVELVVFDDQRGHVATIDRVVRDGYVLGDDGTLLVMTSDAIQLYPPGATAAAWRVPYVAPHVVPRFLLTDAHAFVAQESIRVLNRADGSLVREVPPRVNVGFDAARGEMLWLRDGRIVVENALSGAELRTLDVSGGAPLVDAMEEPLLLGAHADTWIILYSTELDHIFEGSPGWTRAAPRTMVAVRPETGEIAWRTEIGRWEHDTGMNGLRALAHGVLLPAEVLFHFDGDREGGGPLVGHLVYVSLRDGAIRWQTDYQEPTRSNALFERVGAAAFLLVRDVNDGPRTALARFEGGRLTGAAWLPEYGAIRGPAMTETEVWLPTQSSWAVARGDEMRIGTRGMQEPPIAPGDPRAWVADRLQLPQEAR